MKNVFFSFVMALLLLSCSKSEMQQTHDTVRSADSLFTKASGGLNTLDSISKIVRDSAKFNKVIVPQIQKTKESVEKAIRENAGSLDSVNAVLKKARNEIERSAELMKTVDSAGRVLQDTGNPIDVLSTISKTLEKVTQSRTTAEEAQNPLPTPQQRPEERSPIIPDPATATVVTDPIIKSAEMEITVDDLSTSRADLAMELRKFGGAIVSENLGEQDGFRKQVIRAKIPSLYFDEASKRIPERLGMLKSKHMVSSGSGYDPNQMSDLEITLSEKRAAAVTERISQEGTDKGETADGSYSGAFMKGFNIPGQIFMALLPFWPVFLIVGLVWYFINRRNKKREAADAAERQPVTDPGPEAPSSAAQTEVPEIRTSSDSPDEDPYAKYKPKG